MRFLPYLICAIAFALCTPAQGASEGQSMDFGITLTLTQPTDDTFDYGGGVEAFVRYWFSPYFGVSAMLAGESWEADEETSLVAVGDSIGTEEVDGHLDLVPLGLSAIVRTTPDRKVRVNLEGGIRYVILDSNIDVSLERADSADRIEDDIDIDNGVVGIIRTWLDWRFDNDATFFAGLGYQFDISQGNAELFGEDIGDIDLEALTFLAGFSWLFY